MTLALSEASIEGKFVRGKEITGDGQLLLE